MKRERNARGFTVDYRLVSVGRHRVRLSHSFCIPFPQESYVQNRLLVLLELPLPP